MPSAGKRSRSVGAVREKRSREVKVRFTEAELLEVVEGAAASGLSQSEFIRRRSRGVIVRSSTDVAMLRSLRSITGLMKHLITQAPGEREQLNAVFVETHRAIYAIEARARERR